MAFLLISSESFITSYSYSVILGCMVVVQSGFIVIRIPRDIVEGAKIPENEFERVARIELVVALYAKGILSLGQARRLAGLSKWGFLEELGKRRVCLLYTSPSPRDLSTSRMPSSA